MGTNNWIRLAVVLALPMLAGCGPVLIALGITEATEDEPAPSVVPTVGIASAPEAIHTSPTSTFRALRSR